MEKKLTERQKRWIDYYIETGNATEACRRAGYKVKNADKLGHENLRKLEKYYKPILEEKQKERIATQDEILQFLTRVIKGEEEGATMQDKIKCADLLGKRYGAWIERQKVETSGETTLNIVIKDDQKEWGK